MPAAPSWDRSSLTISPSPSLPAGTRLAVGGSNPPVLSPKHSPEVLPASFLCLVTAALLY